MRTLVLLLLFGCAHNNNNANPPPPPPPQDPVLVRACDSCRHNLELCRDRSVSAGSAEHNTSGTATAQCMDEFMTCLSTQGLDGAKCQGLN